MRAEATGAALRKRLGSKLDSHVPLKDLTALGIGGVADYFFSAATPDELIGAVRDARRLGLPVVVLGAGSHVLVSDYGVPGLVIANRSARLTLAEGSSQIVAESGVPIRDLVLTAAGRSLAGLGPLLTLSGTLGGLLASGASPAEMNLGSAIRQVTILRFDGTIVRVSVSDLARERMRETVILTAVIQAIASRPDQVAAEIAVFERIYRRWQIPNTRWLGPILSVPTVRRPFGITEILAQLPYRDLVVGRAAFSPARPNYIEIRGRSTARQLRQLVTLIFDAASVVTDQTLAVHCPFLGSWDDILTA